MSTTKKEKPNKVSKINTWKPKENEIIVEKDGKLFVCHFEKIFGHKSKVKPYKRFIIGKESYINQLSVITSYINFFINNYDSDNELVSSYLKCKFVLDKQKLFNAENMNAYIDFIYEVMFTNTMVEKIINMVEENYLDDIEVDNDKKYVKNEKKHLESLEFTNQHIKLLLQISFGMKIMCPVLFHYIQMNNIKIEKDSDIIFRFYRRLFELFGYGNTWEIDNQNGDILRYEIPEEEALNILKENKIEIQQHDTKDRMYYIGDNEEGEQQYLLRSKINIYNKLYVYCKAKVLESNANNSLIFEQREIFGVDRFTVVHQFTQKVLISENMVKQY